MSGRASEIPKGTIPSLATLGLGSLGASLFALLTAGPALDTAGALLALLLPTHFALAGVHVGLLRARTWVALAAWAFVPLGLTLSLALLVSRSPVLAGASIAGAAFGAGIIASRYFRRQDLRERGAVLFLFGAAAAAVVVRVGHSFARVRGAHSIENMQVPALVVALTLLAAVVGYYLDRALRVRASRRNRDLRRLRDHVRDYAERAGWADPEPPRPPREIDSPLGRSCLDAIDRRLGRMRDVVSAEEDAYATIGQTHRVKNRLVAFLSHDLRSPLNSIVGFSDVLARELDGPLTDEQRESVESIRESAEELLRLITDIVDTARFEAGRLPFRPEEVDVREAMQEALGAAERFARGRGVAFRMRAEEGLPSLWLDRDRLKQALVGVLGHVLRMIQGGEVSLDATRVEEMDADVRDDPLASAAGTRRVYVQLVVQAQDLPLEDSQRIFIAFRDIRRPSGARVAGLGLGLSLARRLVEALGGELRYRSAEGARFTFLLPSARSLPSDPSMNENRPPVSHRKENP